ncbi:GH3 family [Dillenia turbinata]|uniref:GH3 family n=1 Tax=Dillenia turbinata TaxID=194707 RepID=A0AAN8W422_9MAGN
MRRELLSKFQDKDAKMLQFGHHLFMDGKRIEYKGEEALKEIERMIIMPNEIQKDTLGKILSKNGETEYLKKYMGGSRDISDFKRHVPVATYKDFRPYIQRIMNGEDSSLLTGDPITEMLSSSGTSGGEPKLVPSIAEDLDRRTFFYNLILPIMNRYFPGLDDGKVMCLYFVKAERSAPCSLPIRSVLTSYYKSRHFKCRVRIPFHDDTSPDPVILCNDSNQSMYCQLLAGLVHRHQVCRLGAIFASAFLRGVSFLEQKWVNFCDDIRTGRLDQSITDPESRSSMMAILSFPNPTLAKEIEEICSQTSWKGILWRLWPRAKYIEAVLTGSMAQYIPALEFYTEGKIPLISTMYASSECYFGLNLKPFCAPEDVAYTLVPKMGFFEFIPLGENGTLAMDMDEDEEVPKRKLVDLVKVKVGCYYELVVTNFSGLYRYRMGDVLQVTGFHNRAPQFRFICRRNVVLSIDSDKTSEEDLHKSVTVAKKLLEPYDALLAEYTGYADTSSLPGHYVLFWEIVYHNLVTQLDATILQECCIAVEEKLDYVYRRCRTYDKTVGPLEIRVVTPGTFLALMDLFISQGGSINQYKTPRCITSASALELLNANVEASFFSPRYPTWINAVQF